MDSLENLRIVMRRGNATFHLAAFAYFNVACAGELTGGDDSLA